MSQIFDTYKTLQPKKKPNELLAIQVSDEYLFFEEDAKKVSELLDEEMTSFKISYGNNANVFRLPAGRTEEVFGQLIDEGYSIAVVDDSAVSVGSVEQKEETEQPAETPSSTAKQASIAYCQICGKPLKLPESIARGVGDICAEKAHLLGNVSASEHKKSLEMQELPEDWIPLRELLEKGKSVGIAPTRMMKAAGGDRALRKPVHPSFQVMYFKHKRYVHKSALENVEAARLSSPAKEK